MDSDILDSSIFKDVGFSSISEIFDLIPNPIYIKNSKGNFIFCNKAFENFTGFSCEEIKGKTVFDILSKNDAEFYDKKDRDLLKTQGKQTYICKIPLKDSSEFKHVVYNKSTFSNNGSVSGILGIITDITERITLIDALEESNNLYNALFNSKDIGIGYYTIDGRVIKVNKKIANIMGGEPDFFVNKPVTDILGQELGQMVLHRISEFVSTQMEVTFKDTVKLVTGEWSFISTYTLLKNSAGKILGVQILSLDITEFEKSKQQLLVSEERYKSLYDNAEIGIGYYNVHGFLISINKKAASQIGGDSSDLIGKNVHELFGEELGCLILKRFDEVITKIETMTYEDTVNLPTGMKSFISTYAPIRNATQKIVGIQIISTDITERVEIEKKLKESEEKYRVLVESSPVAITITDLNGFTIYANDKAINLYRSENNDNLIGLNVLNDNVIINNENINNIYHKLLKHGTINNLELQIKRKDNSTYYTENNLTLIKDVNGVPYQVISFGTDITERKDKELQLLRFKQAVEQSPNSIVITDTNGIIEYVNPKFTELTGYSFGEAIGKNPKILKSGYQKDEYYNRLWKTILSGNIWKGEFLNKKKNGDLYWEQASISPIRDKNGNIINYIAIKVDITEKKKSDELLANNEKMFRAITSSAGEAIILIDDNDEILEWNKAASKIFGFRRNEVIKKKLHDLIVPSDLRDAALKGLSEYKLHGIGKAIGKTLTLSGIRKDKTKIDVELSISSVKLKDKWHAIGIIRDVTERKKIQDQLYKVTARHQAILSSIPDIIMEVDINRKYIWANQAGFEFFGEHVIGKEAQDFFEGYQNTYDVVKPLFDGSKDKIYLESWQKRHDNQKRLLAWWCKAIKGKDGQIKSILSTARDITEFEELKSQLNHALKMESIGQLASGIAHEINTPLQFINNGNFFIKYALDAYQKLLDRLNCSTGLIYEKDSKVNLSDFLNELNNELNIFEISKEAIESVNRTNKGIERVSKIVQAMKNFAHPSGGIKSLSNINDGINDTVVISHNEWKYVADLKLELDSSLPFVYCCLDEINQVILNLIINASHAIEERFGRKGKEVGLIKIKTYHQGNSVFILITDNGIGIPKENLSKIFDLFFTTKEVGKGTGQGLSIVHDIIVNKHQGKIKVDSDLNNGTTFTLELSIDNKG